MKQPARRLARGGRWRGGVVEAGQRAMKSLVSVLVAGA